MPEGNSFDTTMASVLVTTQVLDIFFSGKAPPWQACPGLTFGWVRQADRIQGDH